MVYERTQEYAMPELKLGLRLLWASDGWVGGQNYICHIARAVALLPTHMRPKLVFLVPPCEAEFIGVYASILPLAEEVRLEAGLEAFDDLDFVYPMDNAQNWQGISAPLAFWIPDLQHCHLPHFFSAQELEQRDIKFNACATGKFPVVFSSQSALDDFNLLYAPTCPTFVLRFCTMPEADWLDGSPAEIAIKYGVRPPYLICCNQFWAHKDHITLFKAFAHIHRLNPQLNLVCTGPTGDYRNPDYFETLMSEVKQLGIGSSLHILGSIDRKHQIQLLRGAEALVQPSLFEGWSTVIEDARLLGKTIIYSDIAVHKEQNPDYGYAFEAGNTRSLVQAINRAKNDFTPTNGTDREVLAFTAGKERSLRFGLDISKMVKMSAALIS